MSEGDSAGREEARGGGERKPDCVSFLSQAPTEPAGHRRAWMEVRVRVRVRVCVRIGRGWV